VHKTYEVKLPCDLARFAYSWGHLAWLIPSEVLSLETRSAGYSITTFINFLMTFVIGQLFLSMLCSLKVRTQQRCPKRWN